ncbi:unnamed protein product [Phytophthora lilii]|uniref:Unnamed protein product n=1 Tax=Phytophthora lilii TaxID=2077276 RepID=A0A9W6WJ47_9STRA|nr:unnamed protein product [Phytophthora lilii]
MNEDEPSVAANDVATLRLRSTEGTYHFLAPECTTGDEYDPYQVDVWALGVTMFTLLLGTLPFGTSVASLSDVMTSIREDPLILPPDLDSECAELLTQLMEKNPRLRITIPHLKAYPWLSGPSGELVRRQSGVEVMVTQQEIEAAFTPVNTFILVMKLKMKMSSRLNNVRKSLASNINGSRRPEAIPVTSHVPVISSVDNSEGDKGPSLPKTTEMAPIEQPRGMNDRLQGRSRSLVDSISESVVSLATTLTRRKSQLGTISPVFDSAAPASVSPVSAESSSTRADHNGCPGVLLRTMSRRNSRSIRSHVPDAPQRTDSARTEEVVSREGHHGELSPDKSGVDAAASPLSSSRSSSLASLNGEKSSNKAETSPHRLTKRKSTSFRGLIRTVEFPEGESIPESTSPINRKKRRESLPGKRDSSSDLLTQNTANVLPVEKEGSPSKSEAGSSPPRRLSRKNSMSFRALVATPESLAAADGTLVRDEISPGNPNITLASADSDANALQRNGLASAPLASTRPGTLSRRLSRRNSRSVRAFNATDTSQRDVSAQSVDPLPGDNCQMESSEMKETPASSGLVQRVGDHDASAVLNANGSPIKSGASPPRPLSSHLSRRKSMSFRALIPMSEGAAGDSGSNEAELLPAGKHSPSSVSPAPKEGDTTTRIEDKPPPKSDLSSPPGLLSRRLSRRSSTSFRALPPTIDIPKIGESLIDAESSPSKASLSEVSPTKSVHDIANATVEGATPTSVDTDSTTSPRTSRPNSPLGSLKIKGSMHSDGQDLQPLRKAKLPVLDMQLSPNSSPVTSPVASPRKAANSGDESTSDSTPRRRSSSPSKTVGAAHLASLRVSPLSRKRSSSLKLDGFSSSSDEGEKPFSPPTRTEALPVESNDLASSDRRATFSSKPASSLPEQVASPQSPPRRLHRNGSMNSVESDDPNSALTRKTSLAKVLDECTTTGRAADRSVVESPPTSPIPEVTARPRLEALATPLTPTRRHHMHVPPLIRPEDRLGPLADGSLSRHHQISPLGEIEKPVRLESSPDVTDGGSKSPLTLEKSRSRRRSLMQAQDSLRLLMRGKSSVRLSMLNEHRGAHYVTPDKVSRVKSKVCAIM